MSAITMYLITRGSFISSSIILIFRQKCQFLNTNLIIRLSYRHISFSELCWQFDRIINVIYSTIHRACSKIGYSTSTFSSGRFLSHVQVLTTLDNCAAVTKRAHSAQPKNVL